MYRANVGRYRENQVMLSTPGEILLALYDGAIRFTGQARIAIQDNDPAAKGKSIGSVMAILAELTSTLDHDRAPDLCENLSMLYNYMTDRLQHAGLHMDIEALDEVIGHLKKLREAWAEAIVLAGDYSQLKEAAVGQ